MNTPQEPAAQREPSRPRNDCYPEVAVKESGHADRSDGFPRVDVEVLFKNLEPHCAAALKLIAPQLPDLLDTVSNEDLSARTRLLLRAFRPPDPVEHVNLGLAQSTVMLRNLFFREVKVLTAHEVASFCGLTSPSPERIVREWRENNVIFALDFEGRDLYPHFQFDRRGSPLPIVGDLLKLFRTHDYSDLDIALWFNSSNGWLSSETPITVLTAGDTTAVAELKRAATQTILQWE